MNTLKVALLASLVAAIALPATGCIMGCGAYEGAGDRVYAREGGEMLIVCNNGGFVANLQTTSIEGRIEYNTDGTAIGVKGDDQSLAFDLIVTGDEASTPQLGAGMWAHQKLDATAHDHADVLCQDLQTRAWWAQQ
jgi:hypothetical protein